MELRIEQLSKSYRDKAAVRDVNIIFDAGIWGLLGANGAGKTTLIRMMSGILKPTGGRVIYNGCDVRDSAEFRADFGFLPQEVQFGRDMTVYEYLCYVAAIKNVPEKLAKSRIEKLLSILTLTDVKSKGIVKLSGGMKRRVGIAQAMLNDPKILILDEPTAGLDPGERIRFRRFLSSLSKDRIIILSTHIVSDIEDIADKVVIMKGGKLNCVVKREDYEDLEELYISIFAGEVGL